MGFSTFVNWPSSAILLSNAMVPKASWEYYHPLALPYLGLNPIQLTSADASVSVWNTVGYIKFINQIKEYIKRGKQYLWLLHSVQEIDRSVLVDSEVTYKAV